MTAWDQDQSRDCFAASSAFVLNEGVVAAPLIELEPDDLALLSDLEVRN